MPETRCKHFWSDGSPLARPCTTPGCPYVHPEDKLWESLPPYKLDVRCKYFDNDGSTITECPHGSEHCRFIHPDDPRWARAQPTTHKSRLKLFKQRVPSPATSSAGSSTARRKSLPRLRTEILNENFVDPPLPKTLDVAKQEGAPESDDVDPHISPRRVSSSESSMPMHISPSVRVDSPTLSLSAYSQAPGGSRRQAWKTLISSLSQAVNLRQQKRDVEKRLSLRSDGNIRALLPSEGADHLQGSASRKIIQEIDDELDTIVTRLMEVDFWPVPTVGERIAPSEQRERVMNLERLNTRLSGIEAQLSQRAKSVNTSGTVVNTERVSPPSKRRRLSPDNSFIQSSDVKYIMDRLDRVEQKMHGLEEGEIWNDDGVTERIEELIENKWNIFFPDRTHETQIHSGETLQKPVEALIRNLERDFAALCEELAGTLPQSGKLQAGMERLRLDQGDVKLTMTSSELSCEQLRERLDLLSRETNDLSLEIIKRRDVRGSQLNVAEEHGYIARAVVQDIKSHIASVQDDVKNVVASQFKAAQEAATTNFESTIKRADMIYISMGKEHVNGATRDEK